MAVITAPTTGERVDRLQPYRSVIVITRWVTLGLSLIDLAVNDAHHNTLAYLGLVGLTANVVFRTFRPLKDRGTTGDLLAILCGVAIHAVVVGLTGFLDSPFVFTLVVHVVMAGLSRGLMMALAIAVLAPAAIGAADIALTDGDPDQNDWVWIAWLVLVAVTSTYARRISGEANRRQLAAMDRLSRLADANALLFALHRVAQTLPVSLDLNETVESTVGRLHDLFDHDLAALLLFDETDHGWQLARTDGPAAAGSTFRPRSPPAGCRRRWPGPWPEGSSSRSRISPSTAGPGLWSAAGSGLYIVLPARGAVVGLIAARAPRP